MQQRCLRTVTGAFKATSRQTLEHEAAVPPLRAHIARLQLQARARLAASGSPQEINIACRRLRGQLAPQRGPRRTPGPTPGNMKHEWARDILWRQQQRMEDISSNLGLPPWSDHPHRESAQDPMNSRPPPQTLWQAYQLAEQWCWD